MKTEYFLGANSAEGFYSLYDAYCRERGGYFHLIKGGPGSGKSSFMKKIAETALDCGHDVEQIRCSGDPTSLDGVYIPSAGLGWLDATAPHVIEPSYFGECSNYVNFGKFCRRTENEDIEIYTRRYKQHYESAYSYLKAVKAVKNAKICGISDEIIEKTVRTRAKNTAKRELKNRGEAEVKASQRFISAVSGEGIIVLTDTLTELCNQVIALDDRCGFEQIYFAELLKNAGYEMRIVCPSPLDPERVEAVLFPERGLGFAAASLLPADFQCRHIRLDALARWDKERRRELRRREKLCDGLLTAGCEQLRYAKKFHDELEKAYRDCIDFAAVDAYTEQELEKLGEYLRQ